MPEPCYISWTVQPHRFWEEGTKMPKVPQGQGRPAGVIGRAFHIALIATSEEQETAQIQQEKRDSCFKDAKLRLVSATTEYRKATVEKAAAAWWV